MNRKLYCMKVYSPARSLISAPFEVIRLVRQYICFTEMILLYNNREECLKVDVSFENKIMQNKKINIII